MVKNLSTIFRYFFFWLLFFFLERLVFILWFGKKLQTLSIAEISKSFVVGLWMDASMAGYIVVLPLLLTIIKWFIPKLNIPSGILKWYTIILIVVFSIICVFNFNIYREWGSKINYKALDFAFSSPNEALASSASSPIFISLLVLLGIIAISVWLTKRIISYQTLQQVSIFIKAIASICLIVLNFLFIRGGWQLSPINESMAYYSNSMLLNHATINTEWSLIRDILKNRSDENPYLYYQKNEADSIIKEFLIKPKAQTTEILLTEKPNVVLIILESFTADLVESLGGEKGVAPEMEKLISKGVLFDNIYSSGDRTDKGVVAILSAFPSQATRSIMKVNSKHEKLPSLAEGFAENGYPTAFYYGGESEFANMKSYLRSNNYQKIIDKTQFEKKDMNSKWGAFDGQVFDRLVVETEQAKPPFFATLLSITNHEPFEVPGKPHFAGEDDGNKFRSTAFYTDSCVGAFINDAKNKSWYKNTLFIVVADHGHRLPKNQYEIYQHNRFRIPLLFFGDVIKPEYRGKRISKIGSQTDIAATLFNQLKMNSDRFKWSRDLLNPQTSDFAFFNWDNGFGVVSPKQAISFDNTGRNVIFKKNTDVNLEDQYLLKVGKAYMQEVYQDYLDY
ncbi:MAG: LTA synthase family protein [Sphingobacteriaceae bacterium]